ncbi:MAG: FAD-dependent oxidoreductase [Haloarculaceae archaeon]
MDSEFVIVGDGVAGSSAARILTETAPEATVTVVTAEDEPLYNRILIKELAKGKMPEEAVGIHDVAWYDDRQIDLRLDTRVETVDVNADTDDVHTLWTIEHARRLREAAREGDRGVVIGAGLLGLDMAAILAVHDVDARYLMRGTRWWRYAMSETGAEIIHETLREHGVEPVFESGVDGFLTTDGELDGVRDTNGRTYEADLATVAVGTDPNTGFLEDTPVDLDSGVLVDEYMHTGVPGVYAAGDVARHYDSILGDRVRNGSWDSAQQQGVVAAHNMLDPKSQAFDCVPTYSVDHFEFPFLSFGHPTTGETYAERTYDDREWRRLAFRDDRLVGGILVGDLAPQRTYKRLIRSQRPVADRTESLLARDVRAGDVVPAMAD